MLHSIWKAVRARPIMSSMIGLAFGTAGTFTVASAQPQIMRPFDVASNYRVAQGEPGPGGQSGGGGGSGPRGGGGGSGGGMNGPGPQQGGGKFGGGSGPQGGGFQQPRQEGGGFREPGQRGDGGMNEPSPRMDGSQQPPQPRGGGETFQPRELREPREGSGNNQRTGGFENGNEPRNNPQANPPDEFRQTRTPEGNKPDDHQGNQQGNDNGSQMGGQDQSQNQEEQDKRMKEDEARQEAQRKQQEERSLQMMKKGMAQAAKGVAQIKKFFSKNASKGITIPTNCTDALAKIQATVDTIIGATTFEDAQNADPESMRDDFDTLNECQQKVSMLAQIPTILKRVDREIKTQDRNWTRSKKNAPADAQEAVSEGNAVLQSIKDARQKINDLVKAGDVEELKSVLEDDIYGRFDDLGGAMQKIDAARNAKQFVSAFASRIREAERMIANLKKRGDDTTELSDILAKAKQLYAQIKTMKPGTDEYDSAIDKLTGMNDDFAKATGSDVNVDNQFQGPGGSSGSPPQIQLPQF